MDKVSDLPMVLRLAPDLVVMDLVRALAKSGMTLRTDQLGRVWIERIPELIRARG